MTPAVKAIIYRQRRRLRPARSSRPALTICLGLTPRGVRSAGASGSWPRTCSSIVGVFHILFNMLAVWMFGVELERRWGTRGVRHATTSSPASAPAHDARRVAAAVRLRHAVYYAATDRRVGRRLRPAAGVGAALPDRQIMFFSSVPVPARTSCSSSAPSRSSPRSGDGNGGVAAPRAPRRARLRLLYLTRGPTDLCAELRVPLTKWRMERMRRKFNVHRRAARTVPRLVGPGWLASVALTHRRTSTGRLGRPATSLSRTD